MRFVCVLLLFVVFAAEAEAQRKPAPKKAMSNMALKRYWIARDKLPYIRDSEFPRYERDGVLVRMTHTRFHSIDGRLDRDAQFVRRHVLDEIASFEQGYYKRFHERLPINSGFRTQEHHEELRTRNSNAALGQSPHSTGATIDISYLWMSVVQRRYVERWLKARHRKTLVYTKEYHQKVYDVFFRAPSLKAPPRHRRFRK